MLDVLAYAHGKGNIHRDIKPSNVMVDPEGHVKVADFGLAKIIAADSSLLTASDAMIGSPDLMAPEALSGMAEMDDRADLFAVGAADLKSVTVFAEPGKQPRASRGWNTAR